MFNCFPAFLRSFYCALRRAPCTLYHSFNEIEKRRGEQTQAMPQKNQAAPKCGTA
jgi:hypothetical protein